jgi:hypothetical protein
MSPLYRERPTGLWPYISSESNAEGCDKPYVRTYSGIAVPDKFLTNISDNARDCFGIDGATNRLFQ